MIKGLCIALGVVKGPPIMTQNRTQKRGNVYHAKDGTKYWSYEK
jgi:hypothetical protein